MYEVYERLLKEHGVTTADVCKATGISQSTMSNWKKRKNLLSTKNAQLVANYFGVSIEYLNTGTRSEPDGYYFDPRTAEIAQAIANSKELVGLFDAARKASPEDLITVQTMLEALHRKEKGE